MRRSPFAVNAITLGRQMFKADYHIVPMEGGYVLEREGARRPISTHTMLDEAVRAGRVLAQHNHTRLIIHESDRLVAERPKP